jgi:ornithine cyclodeaminase/alanine dehydrogenase-like protein (mu-crystallin family)
MGVVAMSRSAVFRLAGTAPGRESAEETTVFDSTGLAIQDLAIALAAMERAGELELSATPV